MRVLQSLFDQIEIRIENLQCSQRMMEEGILWEQFIQIHTMEEGEGGWWKTSSWSLAVPIWIGDIMAAATSADLLHVFPHGHALNKVFGSFEVNCIEAPKERNNLKGWNNWKEGRFWKYRP